MAQFKVRLEWLTGVNRPIFQNVRLVGSWDGSGRYSDQWRSVPMTPFTAPDGCPGWYAEVDFDDAQRGWTFHWGVVVDAPQRVDAWGITTEVPDPQSTAQHRDFILRQDGQVERCWLSHSRRLGANKVRNAGADKPAIRFAVWAPNANKVDLVTADPATGYIWNDGRGVQRSFALSQDADGPGIWASNPADPAFADFSAWDHMPYMFRIEKDDGTVAFRTDLYSRCQIGAGRRDPENPREGEPAWNGTPQDLDGVKGCSVVINADTVTERIDDTNFPPKKMVPEADFWANEFDPLRPVPDRLDELIIYEMHVGGLGLDNRDDAGNPLPGSFVNAVALLDHLVELGINAVELMPATEAEGWTWGYGSSHYFATEYSSGGRDLFKHFVRACHQRGIAVLMDVVYNHYSFNAERAESLYDSNTHAKDIYYWYQGQDSDWSYPGGGYLQNGSAGRAPDYRSELVRNMFASSAVMLMTEFHVDGFRVDLTQAFHRDNVIEANGAPVPDANRLGTKLLREWVRTLRLVKPTVILTAEDHTGWSAITQPQETGGIGFDAIWWAEWYHHVIGDSQNDSHNARLLYVVGFGGNDPLAMSYVAGALQATPGRVIYHESHDQAGNASYRVGDFDVHSARTIQTAVNGNLNGTRFWAEARCRVVSGLTLLAPGIPMFFMGEEVGAQEPYRYSDWLDHREDFQKLRKTTGAKLFRFYRDVIRLRRRYAALTSPHVEILHVHDANRVLAFRRWLADAEFLIFASLNNSAFADGYWIGHPALRDGGFIEVLNSDAEIYGGLGVTNPGMHYTAGNAFNARLPANGIVVFQRV